MAMGLVTEEEFLKEVASISGIKQTADYDYITEEVRSITRGRGDKKETPEIVRELIATESLCGTTNQELAQTFGVSESSVSAYKNGATSTSTYHQQDARLATAIDETRNRIVGTAQSKLIHALDKINLTGVVNPRVASGIARDMSSVVKNLQPDVPAVANVNARVIVYQPRMKEEDDYNVITVDE